MTQANIWLSIPDAFAAALIARSDADSITLDMQHGLFDEAAVARTLLAVNAPFPLRYVRVPSNDAYMIGKILDLGADGVIVPMVNSEADAHVLSASCHYPPHGNRSFGPSQSVLRDGPSMPVQAWAMIETAAALNNVEAIASVPGITGLYVGPNDLGLALGFGMGSDRREQEIMEAFKIIVDAAHRADKQAGLYCRSADYAADMARFGFDLLTVTNDAALLRDGAATSVATFRAQEP